MSSMDTNGRAQRKSLAGQLDRLDAILDGLADGLNEAVATVVMQAVSKGVEAALREVLTNAELQHRLRPEPVAGPGVVQRAASGMGRGLLCVAKGCWGWVARAARGCWARTATVVGQGVPAVLGRVRRGITGFARRVWSGGAVAVLLARRYRRPLLVALAVGTVLGLGCYLAGPAVASFVSGLAGFAASLVASALSHLRRVLGSEGVRDECFGRLA